MRDACHISKYASVLLFIVIKTTTTSLESFSVPWIIGQNQSFRTTCWQHGSARSSDKHTFGKVGDAKGRSFADLKKKEGAVTIREIEESGGCLQTWCSLEHKETGGWKMPLEVCKLFHYERPLSYGGVLIPLNWPLLYGTRWSERGWADR